MKVEIEDVLFWMDAIRNSDDRYRTLESFWKGQIRSKVWLIENLAIHAKHEPNNIVIHGGWNGVLSSLIFNSEISVNHVTSVDIDPKCEKTATTVNNLYTIQGKFKSKTADMKHYKYNVDPDIVINTSAEHVCDETLRTWFNNISKSTLVVVQSNNFYGLDEHVNCVDSSAQLAEKLGFLNSFGYAFETPKYTRFMLIGQK